MYCILDKERFIVIDHVDDFKKAQQYRDLSRKYKDNLGVVTWLYLHKSKDVKTTEDLEEIPNDDVTEINPDIIFEYAVQKQISEIHFLLANDILGSKFNKISNVENLLITLNYVILDYPNFYLFHEIRENLKITPTLKKANEILIYLDFKTITLEDSNEKKLKLDITEDERTKLIFDKTATETREKYKNSFLIFSNNEKYKQILNDSARHYIRISTGTKNLF